MFLEAPNWVRCRRRYFFLEKWPRYFCKPPTCGYVAAGAFFSPEKWPPYFWKPLMADYVAAGAFFFSRKMALHIFGSPERLTTLPQAPFFCQKYVLPPPVFLEAPNLWVRCHRRFFLLQKNDPIFLEAPSLWAGGLIKNSFLWVL